MAPHKTYSKTVKKLNPTNKNRQCFKKSQASPRKPLTTLQSANFLPSDGLKNSKALKNKAYTETKKVEDKKDKKGYFSSPSFPGSEELSSIWNQESTFDKLLQANTKQTKPDDEIKKSALNNCEVSHTPLSSGVKTRLNGLRSRELLNLKRKMCRGTSHSCCGLSESNSSILSKKISVRQCTSTPMLAGMSSIPNLSEFTPILPGDVPYNHLITPHNEQLASDLPLRVEESRYCVSQLSSQTPAVVVEDSGRNPLHPKKPIVKCNELSSPDMFASSPESSSLSVQEHLCAPSHGNPLDQPEMERSSSVYLTASRFSDKINLARVSVGRSRPSQPLEVVDKIVGDKCSGSDRSRESCCDLAELGKCPILDSSKEASVCSSTKSDSSSTDNSDTPENNIEFKDTSCLGRINSLPFDEKDCASLCCSTEKDSSSPAISNYLEVDSKSKCPTNSLLVDENICASLHGSTEINCSLKESTKNLANCNAFKELSCFYNDSDTTDYSLEKRKESDESTKEESSEIETDFEVSYNLSSTNVACPVLEYVNLRNRKVRWTNTSSVKNLSALSNQPSLSKINEDKNEEDNEEPERVTSPQRVEPIFAPDTELQPVCHRVAPLQPPFARPSRAPPVAIARASEAGGKEARRRLASRRFSVAPSKMLALPRADSVGFRNLHGIVAAPPAEQDAFMSKLEATLGDLSLSTCGTPNISADSSRAIDSFKITARDIVLQKCHQHEAAPFAEVFPEAYLLNCRKIGEGLYGEVFMWECDGDSSVLKIIPIAGNELINGERQKTYEEILSEIVITKELSDLRSSKGDCSDSTCGFVEVRRTACVFGKYPPRLLELWEAYADNTGTENDCPSVFSDSQLFIVLELANGGSDLEKYQFNNSAQAHSIFVQMSYALAVAERRIEFEHRDLHWGNVLISRTQDKHIEFVLEGNTHKIPTHGVQVSIIDFTLSRMTYDGCCIYNDLSQDDSLFASEGDYQFDIYRMMKVNCRNDWREFVPANNVLWLHYIVDKMTMSNGVHYRKTTTKIHQEGMKKLESFKKSLLDFKSTVDFVQSLG